MKITLFAAMFGALLVSAACAAADPASDAKRLVNELIDATNGRNAAKFGDLITADAMFGINDVGFPLSIDGLATFTKECQLGGVSDAKAEDLDGTSMLVVNTQWRCPKGDKQTQVLKIQFMVIGQKIVGSYAS